MENNWSTRYYSASLHKNKWSDIQQDIHGYPYKDSDDCFCIAGGTSIYF